ncbi:tail assembly chaperone [Providencia heimbachae]|nr:tail assembly chaperone [Providencia heimbachae]
MDSETAFSWNVGRSKKKLTETPLLSFAYELAEQLGEIDPYRVLALPATTLLGWQAHFELKSNPSIHNQSQDLKMPASSSSTIDEQCSAVMKMLG